MTIVAGSQSAHSRAQKSKTKIGGTGVVAGSESDTSLSPNTEFSNMPTYRVPCKSSRGSDGRVVVGKYLIDNIDSSIEYLLSF